MNNALRYWGQRYAVSWLERLGGKVNGGRVLEVGCGRGIGVQMILERFGAAWVEAIDLDPKMIEHARRRLASYDSTRVRLSVGNLTSIHAQNGTFDAVFDFGAIHLEPDWRQGIAEARRVLKPDGRFYFEWVTNRFLRSPYPLVTEGFGRMESPSPDQLMRELERQGIKVGQNFVCPKLMALSGFSCDLLGVGRLPVQKDNTEVVCA
jgi:ubiquinone/menaquinone biosynthesis C-methylase UbiE